MSRKNLEPLEPYRRRQLDKEIAGAMLIERNAARVWR